jgi:hypothetical protein
LASDENGPTRRPHRSDDAQADAPEQFDGCPTGWVVEDVGRYLAGDDASASQVGSTGREALSRAACEVERLLRSSYRAHEVVATELRFAGPRLGFRRTVLAVSPSPAALILLCMRMCDAGEHISVLQHTAARGTTNRTARWPFGMDQAEQLTRPPARDDSDLPADLDEPAA